MAEIVMTEIEGGYQSTPIKVEPLKDGKAVGNYVVDLEMGDLGSIGVTVCAYEDGHTPKAITNTSRYDMFRPLFVTLPVGINFVVRTSDKPCKITIRQVG